MQLISRLVLSGDNRFHSTDCRSSDCHSTDCHSNNCRSTHRNRSTGRVIIGIIPIAAKRPVGKWRDDKCLVRSRSRVTGVALEWHQLRCLILEARRPMRESASPKLDASRCPLSLDYPVLSARHRVQEAEKPVQDWALVQIPDLTGAQL